MEFSEKFSQIVNKLSKISNSSAEVFIHSSLYSKDYVVVIDFSSKPTGDIKSSATSKLIIDAFTKAVSELGEIIIYKEKQFQNKNGMSGGFLVSNVIERAKFELLERDAFLYHYRNNFPFKKIFQNETDDIALFEMQSFDKTVSCIIATTIACTSAQSDCILLGLGAHKYRNIASNKAINELNIMKLDHKIRKNWCSFLEKNPEKISKAPDFHHVKSRDIRNLERFSYLCSTQLSSHREYDLIKANNWEIIKLNSPLHFFKYVKVNNPYLLQLDFEKPEPIPEYKDDPIFHPIW